MIKKETLKYAMDIEVKIKYGYDPDAKKMSFENFQRNGWKV